MGQTKLPTEKDLIRDRTGHFHEDGVQHTVPNLEYVGKEMGPISEVAVDHPVFKNTQRWALKTSR